MLNQLVESLATDRAYGFCSVIFCEAVAIYGVIVAIILQTKLETTKQPFHPDSMRAGYSLFASGVIVGFANLLCGLVIFELFFKP